MKRITFLLGLGCAITGCYMLWGPLTLLVAGLILIVESRGMPE